MTVSNKKITLSFCMDHAPKMTREQELQNTGFHCRAWTISIYEVVPGKVMVKDFNGEVELTDDYLLSIRKTDRYRQLKLARDLIKSEW